MEKSPIWLALGALVVMVGGWLGLGATISDSAAMDAAKNLGYSDIHVSGKSYTIPVIS